MKNFKKPCLKRACIISIMSLITINILGIACYSTTLVGTTYGAQGSPISGYDGTTAYTKEFQYVYSYTGSTNFNSTGSVYAAANTDRGGTGGGSIHVNIQEYNLFTWLNHSTQPAYGNTVVIENVPSARTYSYGTSQDGKCSYTNGKTYRGKFEVELLCAPSDASKVTVSPYTRIEMYKD